MILMGVSGSGKTTIGTLLAIALGAEFVEGDALHPAANIAKMHAGHPLDDADRAPWLAAIARVIDERLAAGRPAVITCSALRRAYRDVLIGARHSVVLCYLRGNRAEIAGHLAHREGHFMPAALLDSQFDTLEEPGPNEHPLTVDIGETPGATVAAIMAGLSARGIA